MDMLLGHGGRNSYSSTPQTEGPLGPPGGRLVYSSSGDGYGGSAGGMHGTILPPGMGMHPNQGMPHYNNMVGSGQNCSPNGANAPSNFGGHSQGMSSPSLSHADHMVNLNDAGQMGTNMMPQMDRDRVDEQRSGGTATPPTGHPGQHNPRVSTMLQIQQNLKHYKKWFMGGTPLRCLLPDNTIGLVMGPQGRTIKSISQETGGTIQVLNDYEKPPSIQDAICIVYGPNNRCKEATLVRVCEQAERKLDLRDKDGSNQLFMLVPIPAIGAIMGKEGHNIQSIGSASGCKLKVMEVLAYSDKIVSILGPTIKDVAKAIVLVNNKIQETFDCGKLTEIDFVHHLKAAEQRILKQGPGAGRPSNVDAGAGSVGATNVGTVDLATARSRLDDCEDPSNVVVTFIISKPTAGWIIGVQGQHRKSIEHMTGAMVQVLNEAKPQLSPQPDDRTLEISGSPVTKCEAICVILRGYDEKRHKETGRDTSVEVPVRMVIPQRTLKHIIGKEGAMINQLQTESGAHIQVIKHLDYNDVDDRLVEISGTIEAKIVGVLLIQHKLESLDKPPSSSGGAHNRTPDTPRPASATHQASSQGHRAGGGYGGASAMSTGGREHDGGANQHLRTMSSSPRHSSLGPDKKRRKGAHMFDDMPTGRPDRDTRHDRDHREDRRDRERDRDRERERDPRYDKELRGDERERRYGLHSLAVPQLHLPPSRGNRQATEQSATFEDTHMVGLSREEIPSEVHFLNIAQTHSFPRVITCQEIVQMDVSFPSEYKQLALRYSPQEDLTSMIADRTGALVTFHDLAGDELKISLKGTPIGTCTALLLIQEHFIDTMAYDARIAHASDRAPETTRSQVNYSFMTAGLSPEDNVLKPEYYSKYTSSASADSGHHDVEEGELDGPSMRRTEAHTQQQEAGEHHENQLKILSQEKSFFRPPQISLPPSCEGSEMEDTQYTVAPPEDSIGISNAPHSRQAAPLLAAVNSPPPADPGVADGVSAATDQSQYPINSEVRVVGTAQEQQPLSMEVSSSHDVDHPVAQPLSQPVPCDIVSLALQPVVETVAVTGDDRPAPETYSIDVASVSTSLPTAGVNDTDGAHSDFPGGAVAVDEHQPQLQEIPQTLHVAEGQTFTEGGPTAN